MKSNYTRQNVIRLLHVTLNNNMRSVKIGMISVHTIRLISSSCIKIKEEIDRRTDRPIDGRKGWMDGWMEVREFWMNGWLVEWVDEFLDGWMDPSKTHPHISIYLSIPQK